MALTWAGVAWAGTTAYILGARVINGTRVYVARAPGTSAGSGGPTGTGTGIVDGGVTWDYAGPATVYTVVGVAPELSTVGAAQQALDLDAAVRAVDPAQAFDDTDLIAAYLAAHLATLSRSRGKGPVASEGVGSISRAYGSMLAQGATGLGATSYGLEAQRLIRLTPAGLGATTGIGF